MAPVDRAVDDEHAYRQDHFLADLGRATVVIAVVVAGMLLALADDLVRFDGATALLLVASRVAVIALGIATVAVAWRTRQVAPTERVMALWYLALAVTLTAGYVARFGMGRDEARPVALLVLAVSLYVGLGGQFIYRAGVATLAVGQAILITLEPDANPLRTVEGPLATVMLLGLNALGLVWARQVAAQHRSLWLARRAEATLRQELEQRLRREAEQEESARDILEGTSDLIQSLAPDGRILYANRAWHDTLGYTEDEARNMNVFDVIHPESLEHCRALFTQIARGGNPGLVRVSFKSRSGRAVALEGQVSTRSSRGAFAATRGIFRDVTEREQAETALRQSEARLRRLNTELEQLVEQRTADLRINEERTRRIIDTALDAVITMDADGRVRGWNPQAERTFGWSAAEATGRSLAELIIAPDARASLQKELEQFDDPAAHSAHERRFELTAVTRDGRNIQVEFGIGHAVVRRELQISAFVRDITERRRAEDLLRRSEERYRHLVSTIPGAVFELAVDTERRPSLSFVSDGIIQLLGVPASECLREPAAIVELLQGSASAIAMSLEKTAHEGGQWVHEFQVRWHTGEEKWLRGQAVAHVTADGAARWQGVLVDVTTLKQSEQETAAALREKEVLLKEIHHRVKNNLQVVSSLLAMQADMTDEPATRLLFKESIHRVRSMALIHERLYQSESLARIDFGEYAQALTHFLVRAYDIDQAVTLDLDVSVTPINVETAVPCGLILNELVSNALKHAFREGPGTLRIRVGPDPRGGLHLLVADSGPGLPHGFELAKSTSLGMQLVASLTGQVKGQFEFRNANGAEFDLRCPELLYSAR